MLAAMIPSRSCSAALRAVFPIVRRTPLATARRGALVLALSLWLLGSPFGAASAGKAPVWLATGPAGGTYRAVYGANLVRLLPDFDVFFRESQGSLQNLQQLLDGQADVAFVQADVYALARETRPEVARDLQVVGRLADECVYLARRKDGRIGSFDDLKKPAGDTPARIAVGPPEGGPAGTWLWLAHLEPALAGVEADPQGGTLALNQLAVGRFDAVLWVTDPANRDQKMTRALVANEDLELAAVSGKQLLEPLPDGTVVYRKQKVKGRETWTGRGVETICTTALVLMRRDADALLLDRVSDAIGLHRDAIVPRAPRS